MNRKFRNVLCVCLSTLLLGSLCLPALAEGEDAVPVVISAPAAVAYTYTESTFAALVAGATEDTLVISTDSSAGLVVTFDPAWVPEDIGLRLEAPFTTLSIPYGAIAELAERKSGALTFAVYSSLGDVTFELTQDGENYDFYTFKHPMTLEMVVFAPGMSYGPCATAQVFSDDSTAIIPRSFTNGASLIARIHGAGRYVLEDRPFVAFSDTQNLWMNDAVQYLQTRGVVRGVTAPVEKDGVATGTFAPNRPVTRAEFTSMLMQLLYVQPQGPWMPAPFADQATIPDWAVSAALRARVYGVAAGDGKDRFRPNEPITRQDMFVMTRRAMEFVDLMPEMMTMQFVVFNDWDDVAGYAQNPIQDLARLGLANGSNGNIRPTANVTRGEAAQLLYNLLQFDAKR